MMGVVSNSLFSILFIILVRCNIIAERKRWETCQISRRHRCHRPLPARFMGEVIGAATRLVVQPL